MLGLMDCNNFYVSCERVFNPTLENKPVIVLSSNDGCVIARSNEVKQLSIPMGVPAFKITPLIKKYGIHVLSSNYELYGDMSQRIMQLLEKLCPSIEIYSIDEAFINFSGFDHIDPISYAHKLREKIKRGTGIPVSIGLAPTKTLAKVANALAKKSRTGVFCMPDSPARNTILKNFPVEAVWGIGKKSAPLLHSINIKTAYDLSHTPLTALKNFTISVERIAFELQGIPCLMLEQIAPQKSIQVSRSFGRSVTTLRELQEAINTYAAIACAKLRKQHSVVKAITVTLQTSRFKNKDQYYANHKTIVLNQPTDDTRCIMYHATSLIQRLYKLGYDYTKCGVMLFDIASNTVSQYALLQATTLDDASCLMKTIDNINGKYGRNTLCFAAEGLQQAWGIKSGSRSPRYTTQWNELIRVN